MHTNKTVYIFIAVVVLAVIVGSSVYLQGMLSELTGAFERFVKEYPFLSAILFVALASASVLIGPFSSAPIIPFAVAGWGVPLTIAFTFFGWILGDCGAYLIGRYAGRPAVSFFMGRERLSRWTAMVHPKMKFSLLLLFRFAMPAETGYLFGLFSYDFIKYLIITFLAEAPLVFLVVYAGDAFLLKNWVVFGALVGIGIVALVIVFRVFSRHFRENKNE